MIIRTFYLPATDTQGARIEVTSAGRTVRYPWDYSLDTDTNHRAAARAFAYGAKVETVSTFTNGYLFEA